MVESYVRKGNSPLSREQVGVQSRCPNPDCSSNETDLAKAVGPDGSSQ